MKKGSLVLCDGVQGIIVNELGNINKVLIAYPDGPEFEFKLDSELSLDDTKMNDKLKMHLEHLGLLEDAVNKL
jgi:hypothetical protein